MPRKYLILALAVGISLVPSLDTWAQEQDALGAARTFVPERPWEVIDVAIALDTSGSMDLLLETARVKLWEIVNDLTLIEPAPTLRVALVTFGNFANERESSWIKVETDFTEDLDLVSERLFELTADGGTEYIARVLDTALHALSWTNSDETLKLLFVVGNEPADQDPKVSVESMADLSKEAGISLQVVFCGQGESEEAESWRRIAEFAEGRFAAIDHRATPVSVKTPFDEELAKLGTALNETFVPVGEGAEDRRAKQVEQDEKVAKLSTSAAATRAEFKSSPMYSSGWDLVDAAEAGEVDLYELEETDLPENMREMSLDEQEIYLQDMQVRREELRQRIAELSAQRRQYVSQEMEAKGIDTSRTFDTVVREAIREELELRGFHSPEG